MLSIFLLFVEKTQKREIPEFGTFFVLNLHLFLISDYQVVWPEVKSVRTQLHQMMLLSTKCNWRLEGLRARDKKMKLDEEVDAEKEVDYDVSVWLEKDLYE